MSTPVPDPRDLELLKLQHELTHRRAELRGWHERAAALDAREAQLHAAEEAMRKSRLAALNLLEDAVEARNQQQHAYEALRREAVEREQAQAEALRERDLTSHVLESLPGIFYLFDDQGRMLRWNRNFSIVSGYSNAEIAGMNAADFFGGIDRRRVAREVAQVLHESGDGTADLEADFIPRSGTPLPYHFTGQRLVVDGRACIVGVGLDLSERRRAEALQQALQAQLREAQKMEAVGTLAGGIAHDFNNILAGMLGNVALGLDALAPDSGAQEPLARIHRAALRARSLVQQILTFSRRNAPALQVQPLAPLVQETTGMLRATLPAGVVLELALPAEPLHARVDATQIEQVLLNLCTNAWHALPGEGGRIVVRLEEQTFAREDAARPPALAPGRYACITVEDNGCGMDAPTLERIFEPFFTTKPVGSGTGLGLAVAHGIAVGHGGAITVRSQPGLGSRFAVLLPRSEPAEQPADAGEARPAEPPSGQGRRVLYIDDDEIMTLVVDGLLRRAGFLPTCLQDAEQALATLRAQPQDFDLVLTDYNMPRLSGLEVARQVQALRPGLPVLISSGYVDEHLQREAERAGVAGVLHKERTSEELAEMACRALEPDARGRPAAA